MKECSCDIEKWLGYLAPLPLTPSQGLLDKVFSQATAAKIFQGGMRRGRPIGNNLLIEVHGEELSTLRSMLVIEHRRFKPLFHSAGGLAVSLLRNGKLLTTLGYRCRYSLSHPLWVFEGILKDGPALINWLESRGIIVPKGVSPAQQAILDKIAPSTTIAKMQEIAREYKSVSEA